jgi:hypothetical protein
MKLCKPSFHTGKSAPSSLSSVRTEGERENDPLFFSLMLEDIDNEDLELSPLDFLLEAQESRQTVLQEAHNVAMVSQVVGVTPKLTCKPP